MSEVIVYSRNNCPGCVKVKKNLDSLGITYEDVNIEQDAGAREMILKMGFRSVPVIVAGSELPVATTDVTEVAKLLVRAGVISKP